MDSSVSNKEKKQFLKWFTQNYILKRRESLWILDYLYNHDLMLEKTHFVEQVEKTKRGIYMSVKNNQNPAFRFYKNGQTFKDPMQAFHEVRLNWSSELFVEIAFDDAWQSPEYLGILEDNPNAKWNETIPEELVVEVDEGLFFENLAYAKELLLDKIDYTLATGKEEEFNQLSAQLKEVNNKLKQETIKD